MRGTWGRRVFGRVERGPKFTRFHLEVEVAEMLAERGWVVSNDELERQPDLYGWVLDMLTDNIGAQLLSHHKVWMRE